MKLLCAYIFTSLSLSLSLSTAYGYGFLMVTGISLLSLLGLILLPFITKNSKLAGLYEYISTLMIALGTSAIFSGAIFHLFPRVNLLMWIEYSCTYIQYTGSRTRGQQRWLPQQGCGHQCWTLCTLPVWSGTPLLQCTSTPWTPPWTPPTGTQHASLAGNLIPSTLTVSPFSGCGFRT